MAQVNVTVPQVQCTKQGCTTPPADMGFRGIAMTPKGDVAPVGLYLPEGWARITQSQSGQEKPKAIYCPTHAAGL